MNKQLTTIVLSRYFCTNKFHFAYYSDSVGVRTQDPQLRRLLLYPAELRNHLSISDAVRFAAQK